MKILLADDSQADRDLAYEVLSDLFPQSAIEPTQNGTWALSAFRSGHPHLVVTDVEMPGMTGLDLLRKVKQEAPATPVVVWSRAARHGEPALALCAAAFVDKTLPDLERRLKDAVRQAMEGAF